MPGANEGMTGGKPVGGGMGMGRGGWGAKGRKPVGLNGGGWADWLLLMFGFMVPDGGGPTVNRQQSVKRWEGSAKREDPKTITRHTARNGWRGILIDDGDALMHCKPSHASRFDTCQCSVHQGRMQGICTFMSEYTRIEVISLGMADCGAAFNALKYSKSPVHSLTQDCGSLVSSHPTQR